MPLKNTIASVILLAGITACAPTATPPPYDYSQTMPAVQNVSGDSQIYKGVGNMRCMGPTDAVGMQRAKDQALLNALRVAAGNSHRLTDVAILDNAQLFIDKVETYRGYDNGSCRVHVDAVIDRGILSDVLPQHHQTMLHTLQNTIVSVAIEEFDHRDSMGGGETRSLTSERMNNSLISELRNGAYRAGTPLNARGLYLDTDPKKQSYTLTVQEGRLEELLRRARCQDGARYLISGNVVTEQKRASIGGTMGYAVHISGNLTVYDLYSRQNEQLSAVRETAVGKGVTQQVAYNIAYHNLAELLADDMMAQLRRYSANTHTLNTHRQQSEAPRCW